MPSRSTKSSNNEDKTLKKLRELALQPESGWDLLWRHKVGELVERLYPAFDRAYGQDQIEGLAKELRGAISPDMLWKKPSRHISPAQPMSMLKWDGCLMHWIRDHTRICASRW